jgi:hypothetical protein
MHREKIVARDGRAIIAQRKKCRSGAGRLFKDLNKIRGTDVGRSMFIE